MRFTITTAILFTVVCATASAMTYSQAQAECNLHGVNLFAAHGQNSSFSWNDAVDTLTEYPSQGVEADYGEVTIMFLSGYRSELSTFEDHSNAGEYYYNSHGSRWPGVACVDLTEYYAQQITEARMALPDIPAELITPVETEVPEFGTIASIALTLGSIIIIAAWRKQ